MSYFDIFKMILFAGVQLVAVLLWLDQYIDFRLAKRVSTRPRANHLSSHFKIFGKIIFVLMNLITFLSFWHNSNWFLSIEPNDWYRASGVGLVAAAAYLYLWASKSRAKSYFHGPYAYIRHPIYFANLVMGFGLCMASGSIWIFLMAIYGSFEIVQSMNREEAFLRKEFPQYETYRGQTKRLVPFLF